jgi:site-specific recombinase XerD
MNGIHERVMKEYIGELTLQGKSTSNPKTALRIFFSWCEEEAIRYDGITLHDAESLQTRMVTEVKEDGSPRYTRRSVVGMVGTIASFYLWLRKKRKVHANPFSEMTRVRSEKRLPRNIPNEEEMDVFLTYFREFWKGGDIVQRRSRYKAHVIAEVMYSSGCRIHEAVALTASDVDILRGTIRIHDSKTKKHRNGILNEYASKVLFHYMRTMREYVNFGKNGADNTLLFGARTNLKVWLNKEIEKAGKETKLGKITSHVLRHACASHLLRSGCDIRYIQSILGHENINSTQVYTKVEKEDLLRVLDEFHPRRSFYECAHD